MSHQRPSDTRDAKRRSPEALLRWSCLPPRPTVLVRRLLRWYRAQARDLPWRRTRDPYAIWISEIMLQQTQVATVIPYFERWMSALPDVQTLARTPIDEVLRLWSGLGYYRRARHLHTTARVLAAHRPVHWPDTVEPWRQLPGVGRYTAGAICSIAFNRPTPIVDGNVTRVLSRLHALRKPPGTKPAQERLWSRATELVQTAAAMPDPASRNCADLNQSLMELGATICTPRSPACSECPLSSSCEARRRGNPEAYPRRAPRPRSEARLWRVLVVRKAGRLLLRRRPAGGLNSGLWEFPTMDNDTVDSHARQVPDPRCPSPQFELRHNVTRYRIRVLVHLVGSPRTRLPKQPRGVRQCWVTPAQARKLALTALHRRILERVTAPSVPA